jgi:hypothetical protein
LRNRSVKPGQLLVGVGRAEAVGAIFDEKPGDARLLEANRPPAEHNRPQDKVEQDDSCKSH